MVDTVTLFKIGYQSREVARDEAEELIRSGTWRAEIPKLTLTVQTASDGTVYRIRALSVWPDVIQPDGRELLPVLPD